MKLILINLLLIFFIIFEHFLIKKFSLSNHSSYEKIKSFANKSVRLDFCFWIACQTVIPALDSLGILAFLSIFGYFSPVFFAIFDVNIKVGLLSHFFSFTAHYPILNWVVWFIAIDFSIYVTHYLMHRIPFLWNWHRFHHLAEDFCVLTTARFALGETLFGAMIRAIIITAILGLPDYATIKALVVIKLLFEWLHHSNLPWDYGRMGIIFVSPRFHRFHHSKLVCDYGKNYAGDLAVWDYLFGTVSERYRADPALGSKVPIGLEGQPDINSISDAVYGYLPELKYLSKIIKSAKNKVLDS
jgi:sterol desaturase/sphingolipid hydroxylase (fatty acid hydroxylase superfamily)